MSASVEDIELHLNQAETQVERINALNALAYAVNRSDPKRALMLAEQAQQLSKEGDFVENPYKKGLAESMRTLGMLKMYEGEYDQAMLACSVALDLAEDAGLQEVKPSAYNTIATVYRQLGDLSTSLEYFVKQQLASEQLGDRLDAAKATVGIGVIYFDMEDYAKFLDSSEQSLAIFRELEEKYWISLALNNTSFALFKLGRQSEALQRGQEGLEISRAMNDPRGLRRILTTLGEIHLDLGEAQKALEYFTDALAQVQIAEEPDLANDALMLVGQAYIRLGQPDLARQQLLDALKHASRYKLRRNMYDCHRLLSETYKESGNYSEALKHYELYHSIKESVFSEENAQKLQNLEVLHRTQKALQDAEYFSKQYEKSRQFNEQLESEVQKRTEDLRAAYEQLERLDRTKSNFISVTAHELRTPLTVMKGYAQMLSTDPILSENQKYKELTSGIIKGSDRLDEIIQTMLLMAKIDGKALEVFPEPQDISDLIFGIASGLGVALRGREQRLVIDESLRKLPAIQVDRTAIAIVFTKLIENAIKYTPDGGVITISGSAWQPAPAVDLPDNSIEIVVSDTGIGIDPEDCELILTKFYQTGDALRHSSGKVKFKGGGPGLGLAIARGIVEAHQGKLWAESKGHDEKNYPGSQFHVVLPVKQS